MHRLHPWQLVQRSRPYNRLGLRGMGSGGNYASGGYGWIPSSEGMTEGRE
jgi:hypothetical protein